MKFEAMIFCVCDEGFIGNVLCEFEATFYGNLSEIGRDAEYVFECVYECVAVFMDISEWHVVLCEDL